MNVKCIKYTQVDRGTLKGFVDLILLDSAIELYGCKLFQKDKQRWVSLPAREQTERGEIFYVPVIKFSNTQSFTEFSKAAKKAIDEFVEEKDGK